MRIEHDTSNRHGTHKRPHHTSVGSIWITAAVLLAGIVLASVPVAAEQAEILSTTGRVEVRLPGEDWTDAQEGMMLPIGASVSTGFNAQTVLEIGPARLEVSALSRMTLEELIEQEGLVSSDLHLQVGRVRAEVREVEGTESQFNLRSPVATAAVRGTSFEFDGVNVRVFTGEVSLANRYNQRVAVAQGESSSTTGDDVPAGGDTALESESSVAVSAPTVEAAEDDAPRTRRSTDGSLRVFVEFGGPR